MEAVNLPKDTPVTLGVGVAGSPYTKLQDARTSSSGTLALQAEVPATANPGSDLAAVSVTKQVVRGGISIALALSIGDAPHRSAILAATYTVAVFTIVVPMAAAADPSLATLHQPRTGASAAVLPLNLSRSSRTSSSASTPVPRRKPAAISAADSASADQHHAGPGLRYFFGHLGSRELGLGAEQRCHLCNKIGKKLWHSSVFLHGHISLLQIRIHWTVPIGRLRRLSFSRRLGPRIIRS